MRQTIPYDSLSGLTGPVPRIAGLKILNNVSVFLVCLYFLSIFFLYTRASSDDKFFLLLTMLLGGIVFILEMSHMQKRLLPAYLVFSLVVFSYCLSAMVLQTMIVRDIAMMLSNAGIVLALLRRRLHPAVMYCFFFSLSIFFLYHMVHGSDVALIFGTSSRNAISFIMITACVLLYVSLYESHKNIPVFPAFITLFFSIWAIGRSGIVSSAILFLGVLILGFHRIRFKLCLLTVCLLVAVGSRLQEVVSFLMDMSVFFYRFERAGLYSVERAEVIKHYLSLIDAKMMLFGYAVREDPFMAALNYNLHNSFLSLHSQIGIASVAIVFVILLGLTRALINNKLYALCILVISVRIFTDDTMFFYAFDFVLFFLVLSTAFQRAEGRPHLRTSTSVSPMSLFRSRKPRPLGVVRDAGSADHGSFPRTE